MNPTFPAFLFARLERARKAMSQVLLVVVVSGLCSWGHAAPVVTSESFLFDKLAMHSIDTILEPQVQSRFKPPGPSGLSFGWVAHPIWIMLDVENQVTDEKAEYLAVEWPLVDDLQVYYLNDRNEILQHYSVGDRKPFYERTIFDTHFVFPFPAERNDIERVVFRLHTSSSSQLPYTFYSEKAFIQSRSYRTLIQGAFFGFVAVIIFYTFFLWLSTRRSAYIHYVMFVATFGLVQAGVKGTGFQYLWPQFPQLNDYAIATAGALNLIFLNTFAREFLRLSDSAWMTSLSNIFIALGVVFTGLSLLLPYILVVPPLAITIILSAVVLIFMGSWRYRQGYREARFYLMAWAAMVTGSVIYLLKQLGVLPMNVITENSMQLGSALEMMLLSLALADRLNTMSEKLEAANVTLEKQVASRTSELQQAMENLGKANSELAKISVTDRLTGLRNRHYFDETLNRALEGVQERGQRAMSLLLMDIDHFKPINDTHGHPVGDRAIQSISKIFNDLVDESMGVTCRYGGEEFAVILPATDTHDALTLAEQIRLAVEALSFCEQTKHIPLTISIGVASVEPGTPCDSRSIIKAADTALYQAKENGRNCCFVYRGDLSPNATVTPQMCAPVAVG